jgi:hypothetical protein
VQTTDDDDDDDGPTAKESGHDNSNASTSLSFASFFLLLLLILVETRDILPALVPSNEVEEGRVSSKKRMCMNCTSKSERLFWCPVTGFWFCDDSCRQRYRRSQPIGFDPQQQQQQQHRETDPTTTTNFDSTHVTPVRRSNRTPDPPKTTQATKKKTQKASTTTTTTTTTNKKKRSLSDEQTGRHVATFPIQLIDSLSPRQFRITEKKKSALEDNRLIFSRMRETQSEDVNAQQLRQLQDERDSILEHYQKQIELLSEYVDLVEQACEVQDSLHIQSIRPRYDTIQEWSDADRVRLENLRAAYDFIKTEYSDENLYSSTKEAIKEEHETSQLSTPMKKKAKIDNNNNNNNNQSPTDHYHDPRVPDNDNNNNAALLELLAIVNESSNTPVTTHIAASDCMEIEPKVDEIASSDNNDAQSPVSTRYDDNDDDDQPVVQATTVCQPMSIRLNPDGTIKFWPDALQYSEQKILDFGYVVFRKSRDGTLRFYLQRDEPAAHGPVSAWIPFVRQLAHEKLEKLNTRGRIVIAMSNNKPLGPTLTQRILQQSLALQQQRPVFNACL